MSLTPGLHPVRPPRATDRIREEMKIALAQINPTIGAFKENADRIRSMVDRAKDQACDLIVFSEMVLSGYPPLDLLERPDFVKENLRCLRELMDNLEGIAVICGIVDRDGNQASPPLHNSAVLFENGRILHQAHKRLLPNYDVFDENRYFKPGLASSAFSFRGYRLGLTVCEDIWNDEELYPKDLFSQRPYPVDPVADLIQDGADLIINISASPYSIGKPATKAEMLGKLARKHGVPVLYVNQVGGNDSLLFDGGSLAFNEAGHLVARAEVFEEDLVFFHTERRDDIVAEITGSQTDSVLKALAMGTRDYVHKCGFSHVLVGLSGGIDSALTAAIAVKALGKAHVTGVFMPSPVTSVQTGKDTKALAENLGIQLLHIPINALFDVFLETLSPLLGDIATEITGQNIQARLRGTILMALSNQRGALVLATGNKSELAVGYCTLYGDMVGSLAVIADVPKTLVYELARAINVGTEVIPASILNKAPSAELIPDQADEDDLPPYPLLDRVSKAYIEERAAPETIITMGVDPDIVWDTVARVDRNEYKRHQAPPALKVTTKSFGYGRRYPIARKYTWDK